MCTIPSSMSSLDDLCPSDEEILIASPATCRLEIFNGSEYDVKYDNDFWTGIGTATPGRPDSPPLTRIVDVSHPDQDQSSFGEADAAAGDDMKLATTEFTSSESATSSQSGRNPTRSSNSSVFDYLSTRRTPRFVQSKNGIKGESMISDERKDQIVGLRTSAVSGKQTEDLDLVFVFFCDGGVIAFKDGIFHPIGNPKSLLDKKIHEYDVFLAYAAISESSICWIKSFTRMISMLAPDRRSVKFVYFFIDKGGALTGREILPIELLCDFNKVSVERIVQLPTCDLWVEFLIKCRVDPFNKIFEKKGVVTEVFGNSAFIWHASVYRLANAEDFPRCVAGQAYVLRSISTNRCDCYVRGLADDQNARQSGDSADSLVYRLEDKLRVFASSGVVEVQLTSDGKLKSFANY